MDRFQEMAVFLTAADERSFAAAARRLNISPPTVTRAVAALEERVGTRLLERTTRSVRLTEAGERYLDDCRRILAQLQEMEESAAGNLSTSRRQLVVTAPVLFGEIVIAPLMIDYMDAWPAVTVRALLLDRVTCMIDEGIDVGIRVGVEPDAMLRGVSVGSVRRIVCAAPAFLERYGVPTHPEQLVAYPVVASTSTAQIAEWRFVRGGVHFGVRIEPRFSVNSNQAALLAASRGGGLTCVLSYQVAQQLASGALVAVLADYEPEPMSVEVVCHSARQGSPKIRSFMEFCVARLRGHPALQV